MSNLAQADLTGQMLAAMFHEGDDADDADEEKEAPPSLDEQIQYLLRNINRVSERDRKDVGMILVMRDLASELQYSNQGATIVLQRLPPDVVYQMYQLLRYKLEKK
jgi:hypothetical protein